ncbi:hypothetical protein NC651_037229 [Populus alba x Populus x berolinensis]|nr:hypothetical protein NC651_037229 [Populus alba x Populus x berolinensis]
MLRLLWPCERKERGGQLDRGVMVAGLKQVEQLTKSSSWLQLKDHPSIYPQSLSNSGLNVVRMFGKLQLAISNGCIKFRKR